jgi:hypothetical protein
MRDLMHLEGQEGSLFAITEPEIFVDYESRSNKLIATPKLTRTAGFVSGNLCIASTAEVLQTRNRKCKGWPRLVCSFLACLTACAWLTSFLALP